jgi:hypothetical protein
MFISAGRKILGVKGTETARNAFSCKSGAATSSMTTLVKTKRKKCITLYLNFNGKQVEDGCYCYLHFRVY